MLGTAKTDCLLLGEARTTNYIDISKTKWAQPGLKMCAIFICRIHWPPVFSLLLVFYWAPMSTKSLGQLIASTWKPLENDQLFKTINPTNLSIPYFFFRTQVWMRKFIEAIGICIICWESSVWGCRIANFQFWGHCGGFSVLSSLCNIVGVQVRIGAVAAWENNLHLSNLFLFLFQPFTHQWGWWRRKI